jgi:hypothetical protein
MQCIFLTSVVFLEIGQDPLSVDYHKWPDVLANDHKNDPHYTKQDKE